MLSLAGSCASAGMEGCGVGAALHDSGDARAIDSTAEDEDVAGFGANDEMLLVDGAFDSSGCVGALEVPFDVGAFLLNLEVFRRGLSVGVVAVEGPFAVDVGGRLLRRGLLRPGNGLAEEDEEPETDGARD